MEQVSKIEQLNKKEHIGRNMFTNSVSEHLFFVHSLMSNPTLL